MFDRYLWEHVHPALVTMWVEPRPRRYAVDGGGATAEPRKRARGRHHHPSWDLNPLPPVQEDSSVDDGDEVDEGGVLNRLLAARDMRYHAEVFGQILGKAIRAVLAPLPVRRLGDGVRQALGSVEDAVGTIMAKPMPFWVPRALRGVQASLGFELRLAALFQKLQDHGAGFALGRPPEAFSAADALADGFRRVVMRTSCLLELLVFGHLCGATGRFALDESHVRQHAEIEQRDRPFMWFADLDCTPVELHKAPRPLEICALELEDPDLTNGYRAEDVLFQASPGTASSALLQVWRDVINQV